MAVARCEGDHEARRVAHDVRVRYHVTSSIEDDPGAQGHRCSDLNDLGRDSFDDTHDALLQRARLVSGRDAHTGDPVTGGCGAAAAGCKSR